MMSTRNTTPSAIIIATQPTGGPATTMYLPTVRF